MTDVALTTGGAARARWRLRLNSPPGFQLHYTRRLLVDISRDAASSSGCGAPFRRHASSKRARGASAAGARASGVDQKALIHGHLRQLAEGPVQGRTA
ncbi:hypothetical protein MRX96_030931 [Rhipicephalus microplus]